MYSIKTLLIHTGFKMTDLNYKKKSLKTTSNFGRFLHKYEDFLIIALWACVIPGIHYGTKLCLSILAYINS